MSPSTSSLPTLKKSTLTPDSQALRFLLLVLVLFFVSLELMGDSFKLMGEGVAETLLRMTSNPFVGLFIGILATSLVQSSSTTTTLTVSLVAAEALDREMPTRATSRASRYRPRR